MPASWDIVKQRNSRLLIATIAPPDLKVSMAWAAALRDLQIPPGSDFMKVLGLPFDAARNHAAKSAVEGGYGGLLYVDSDTVVPPNLATGLLAAGRDVIGAMYFRRFPPFAPAACMLQVMPDGKLQPGPLPPYKPGDILPVDFLPTGATYYSRRCLQAMFANFPRPFIWGVDVAPVMDERGQPLFPFSEDFIFSFRAKTLGFQSWLHCGILCRHEFMAVATDKGVEMATA